jgi:initiation factor 1A
MVKNTTGGTGTKSLARKHQFAGESKLRLPECDLEQYACITKMLGNGMCEVYTNDNKKLIAHIRNKFRGKQKRHNMLTVYSIVLVGLREWENPIKNCDILTMYDDTQVEQLKQIPNIKIDNILQTRFAGTFQTIKAINEVDFVDDVAEENIVDLVEKQRIPAEFEIGRADEIDIDDI